MGDNGKLNRYQHTDKNNNGKFRKSPLCDGCNKPVGTNYFTDVDVCGSGDGPGFFLCERKRCMKAREIMTIEVRGVFFTKNRESRT